MTACYDRLLSKQPNPNNPEEEGTSYYKKEDDFALERAKKTYKQCFKRRS